MPRGEEKQISFHFLRLLRGEIYLEGTRRLERALEVEKEEEGSKVMSLPDSIGQSRKGE